MENSNLRITLHQMRNSMFRNIRQIFQSYRFGISNWILVFGEEED